MERPTFFAEFSCSALAIPFQARVNDSSMANSAEVGKSVMSADQKNVKFAIPQLQRVMQDTSLAWIGGNQRVYEAERSR